MYYSRSCNRVAHTLAKQVSDDNRLGKWQFTLSCVVDLVTADGNPNSSFRVGNPDAT